MMLTEKEITMISKFLSYVLRHEPHSIGIQLDENGWVDVEELIQKASKSGVKFDMDTLKYVVETNSKKRFAFNDSFTRIRASQGHSVEVELGYAPKEPPDILYHGTGEKSVESILQTGLEKRSRQHIHLSADPGTAVNVGQRHGKPVVLEVLSRKMHDDGLSFYLSDNGVWLTEHIPAIYIRSKV